MNDQIGRDSNYRIAALQCAIKRAGQDGGLEGGFDIYGEAEKMYQWLKGGTELRPPKPELEEQQ